MELQTVVGPKNIQAEQSNSQRGKTIMQITIDKR